MTRPKVLSHVVGLDGCTHSVADSGVVSYHCKPGCDFYGKPVTIDDLIARDHWDERRARLRRSRRTCKRRRGWA